MEQTRRRLLGILGTVSVGALSGCTEDSASNDDSDPADNDEEGANEDEEETNGNEEGAGDDGERTDDNEEGAGDDGERTDDNEEQQEAVFEVTEVITDGETFSSEDEVIIGGVVTNTGGQSGEQTVEILLNQETIVQETVVLESQEEMRIERVLEETGSLNQGTQEYTVRTQDDERSGSFTFERIEAVFEFSDLSPGEATFEQGEEISFSTMVANTGMGTGEKQIEFRINGETINQTNTVLEPQEEQEIEFTTDSSEYGTGVFEYGFYSGDDEAVATFVIIDKDEPALKILKPTDTVPVGETFEVVFQGEPNNTYMITLESSRVYESTIFEKYAVELGDSYTGSATISKSLTEDQKEGNLLTISIRVPPGGGSFDGYDRVEIEFVE